MQAYGAPMTMTMSAPMTYGTAAPMTYAPTYGGYPTMQQPYSLLLLLLLLLLCSGL